MSLDAMAARGLRKTPLDWTPLTAYALGLAATDGNLGRDGRHVSFGSNDRELVELFVRCVGRAGMHISEEEGPYFRAQISDRGLHGFLSAAGLTPKKSLTLGGLLFPDALFWDVVRGLIDGDGSIKNYLHNPIKRSYPKYQYERLEVLFHTASRVHAEWVQSELRKRGLPSALITRRRKRPVKYAGHLMFAVKMGKHASIAALTNVYRDPTAPRLGRKWRTWESFRTRYSDQNARRLVRKAGAAGRSYAAVSKTAGPKAHVGSNPTSGTESAAAE
jgi:hypothetical protein